MLTRDNIGAMAFDGPLPGEAWTSPKRTKVYDRPAEYSDVEEFLDFVFKNLSKEQSAANFLSVLRAGIPVEDMVVTMLQSAFGEGLLNGQSVMLAGPPLTVMIIRMAEAAGIDLKFARDSKKLVTPDIAFKLKDGKIPPGKMDRAIRANNVSQQELSELPRKEGLMKRPEAIV